MGKREAIIALIDELAIAIAIVVVGVGVAHAAGLVSLRTAGIIGAVIIGVLALIGYLGGIAQLKKPVAGVEALEGRTGIVIEELKPEGLVLLDGEYWRAVSITRQPIPPNTKVVVRRVEGLTLYVEKQE